MCAIRARSFKVHPRCRRVVWTDLCGFGNEDFCHFANVADAEGGVLVIKGEREHKMCYEVSG